MRYGISAWCLPLTLCIAFWASVTHAASFSGPAVVVDGDTIKINNQVIRLYGIDAPENGQNCKRQTGKSYNCGAASENALKELVGARTTCSGDTFDNYERLIAVCSAGDIDINRALVQSGHAVVFRKFSNRYIAEEELAARNQLGMWQGEFEYPWEFRSARWEAADEEAPYPECPIKGNINRKGVKIYHAPWSRSYSRTKINTNKSERWFCSEAEALKAGWRAPYR